MKDDCREKIEALLPQQYAVTQNEETDPPHQGIYDQHWEKGIYVDIVSGEILFSSRDKFDAGCGWPSFSKPIDNEKIEEKKDLSHGMIRTEVHSKEARSHLGHVFTDGPKESGGLRYCINSSSLRFIPYDQMDEEGHGQYKKIFDEK